MTRDYTIGLFFICLVALIWAASSILMQSIFAETKFDSPFLATYIGVSLFTLWLLLPRCNNKEQPEELHVEEEEDDDCVEADGLIRTEQESVPTQQPASPSSWTMADHRSAALRIAPVWFVANWAYNASLEFTSITSSTVLASTGSLFTFLFAILLRDEQFSCMEFAGVGLGVLGGSVTAYSDIRRRRRQLLEGSLGGDALGLVSAVGYGAYAVQTRVLCPKDERLYSMRIMLGYIGLFNLVALSPIAIYQWIQHPIPLNILLPLIVKGLFDNVLSDYLWLRAVMLTNATVATVGLGLTIPIAFCSDIFFMNDDANVFNARQLVGALAVLAGFVLVNVGNKTNDDSDGSVSVASQEEIVLACDDNTEQPEQEQEVVELS